MLSLQVKKQILLRKVYFSLKKLYIVNGYLYIKYVSI